jgi:hypothetical protein
MGTRAPPLLLATAADLDRAGARLAARPPADRIMRRREVHRRIQRMIAASHVLDSVVRAPGRSQMGSFAHRRRFREEFLPLLSGTARRHNRII